MMNADTLAPVTSEKLAQTMQTNPVVVRRIFGGLRDAGFVTSEKGHGGGWKFACDPNKLTLAQIYKAVGSPSILAIAHRTESPGCLIEQLVNAALNAAMNEAEAVVHTHLEKITLGELAGDVALRNAALQKMKSLKGSRYAKHKP